MNPDIKKQWIDALKSGNYAKGKNCLRSADDKYCCLGVLCDLLMPDSWELNIGGYSIGSSSAFLPLEVKNKANLFNASELIPLNDENDTWEPVIEYIEKNL